MRDIAERNQLVEQHLSLAENLAKIRHRTVNPCVQYDELLSAAYAGLIDAAGRYNEAKVNELAKFPFVAYARSRIVGEMNDYLRSCNWGSRQNPQKVRSLDRVIYRSDQGQGRPVYIGDLLYDADDDVVDTVNSDELFEKIIKGLPKMVKSVFRLRYLYNLTMKQVAEKLDISESRVSQIISQHSIYLRSALNSKKEELWDEARSSKASWENSTSCRLVFKEHNVAGPAPASDDSLSLITET